MCNDDTLDVLFALLHVRHVGNDIVDTRHVFFGKLKTNIDNDDITVILNHGAVSSDFFGSTDNSNAEFFLRFAVWVKHGALLAYVL